MAAVAARVGAQAMKALSTPAGQAMVLATADAIERSRKQVQPQKSQVANQSRPGRAAARRARMRERTLMSMPSQMGAMEVCAITNPFCDESKGSRWPDGSSAYSVAVPARFRVYVGGDGLGNSTMLFTTNPKRPVYLGTYDPLDSNIMTGWTGQPSGIPAILNQADSVRVVSAGIKFVSTLSPMTASGSVSLIELPPNESALGPGYLPFNRTTQNRATYVTQAMRDDHGLYGLFRPQGPTSRSFNDYENADSPGGATFETFDWTSLVLSFTGLPTNVTAGFVDVFINYEVSFDVTSDMSLFARPAPPKNNMLMDVSQRITTTANFYRGDDRDVDNTFLGRARAALSSAAGFVADRVPAALRFGVDAMGHLQGRNANPSTGAKFLGNKPQIMMLGDYP